MAIYHCSIKIISRGKGKSAVAAAAYRAGERIENEYDGIIHDYTKKCGVLHTEILLPEHAPTEYFERATLWNAVEEIEKNKNSQLSREIEIALPIELSAGQNISLVREYCNKNFVSKGMCADICIHDKNDGNPHVHIMLTMRPFEQDESWAAKSKKEYILDENGERIQLKSGEYKSRKVCTIDWNVQTKAEEWRQGWANLCNQYLENNNHTERIDHRSFERQGIGKIPSIHLGVAASAMEKRGIKTERGDINREITVTNNQLRQLRARINKAKKWIYSQPLTNAPSMIDMMQGIAEGKNLDARWQKIADLKTRAKLFVFLQENNITDIPTLADKITQLHQSQYDLAGTIKKEERRISTLNQHLAQVDIFRQHKAVYAKYKSLDLKKRDAFYDKHSDEISAYQSASIYLKDHLNGHEKNPEKAWRNERDKLLSQRYAHVVEYYKLRDDVRNVDVLRKGAEAVMAQEPQKRWEQKIEL